MPHVGTWLHQNDSRINMRCHRRERITATTDANPGSSDTLEATVLTETVVAETVELTRFGGNI